MKIVIVIKLIVCQIQAETSINSLKIDHSENDPNPLISLQKFVNCLIESKL